MGKQLEEKIAEELALAEHDVLAAVTGSLQCVQQTLSKPKEKRDMEIARGELGHAYILVSAVEHYENRRFEQTRRVLEHYQKQLYKK